MSFIGVISDNKCFENIKEKIKEKDTKKQLNLIHINSKSIENIKNIKFETIIINNEVEKLKNYESNLKKICINAEYILLNTDINQTFHILREEKANIITYGLNQKSTITVSSISETDILIYIQRNIKNKKNKLLEVEEKRIKIKDSNSKTYEIMIIYIILTIYAYDIIYEI